MKSLIYATIATLVSKTTAQNSTSIPFWKICPAELYFNNTNIAAYAACTQYNYDCPDPNTNGTQPEIFTGPAPSSCEKHAWTIALADNVTGPITIPGVVWAKLASFSGHWAIVDGYTGTVERPAELLNITRLELPDLVDVWEGFSMAYADKIESLLLPKLETVGSGLDVNLSGTNAPAINLSFPRLRSAGEFVQLVGNIDDIDLPVLNETSIVNVTSTGNLDCKSLVDSLRFPAVTIACDSKMGIVTTTRGYSIPSATGKGGIKNGSGRVGIGGDVAILTGLFVLITCML